MGQTRGSGVDELSTRHICSNKVEPESMAGSREGGVPAIPDTLDFLASGGVFFKGVYFVADLEGDDVTMYGIVVCRALGDGGHGSSGGYAGVAFGGRERVDGIAVCDEGEGLPEALAHGLVRGSSGEQRRYLASEE